MVVIFVQHKSILQDLRQFSQNTAEVAQPITFDRNNGHPGQIKGWCRGPSQRSWTIREPSPWWGMQSHHSLALSDLATVSRITGHLRAHHKYGQYNTHPYLENEHSFLLDHIIAILVRKAQSGPFSRQHSRVSYDPAQPPSTGRNRSNTASQHHHPAVLRPHASTHSIFIAFTHT